MAQNSISNRGILFEDISFKEALAKAKAEGKKVFIDCYTQTCGPCKYMMKNIFPLQECGDYFNPKFVSLTRDMDIELIAYSASSGISSLSWISLMV